MAQAFDVKKALKGLYLPSTGPTVVDVPAMTFVMVDGAGNPNDEEGAYARAIQALYSLTYTIKMSARPGQAPEGFFEFVVPPLEGLWAFPLAQFDGVHVPKDALIWTSMIRLPEFVTPEVLDSARAELARKKRDVDTSRARVETWTEGVCVQVMHIGPYDTEPESVARMHAWAESQDYAVDLSDARRHHEIYLADPRRTAPDKLRTVVRHPIRRA
ncbi:MAG: GyrI-like domain-containing protein [Candidatus Nanopelagicales bacterium]